MLFHLDLRVTCPEVAEKGHETREFRRFFGAAARSQRDTLSRIQWATETGPKFAADFGDNVTA